MNTYKTLTRTQTTAGGADWLHVNVAMEEQNKTSDGFLDSGIMSKFPYACVPQCVFNSTVSSIMAVTSLCDVVAHGSY